jgi:hypothetical protein
MTDDYTDRVVRIDHMRCVRDRSYLKRMARKMYGSIERPRLPLVNVQHEHDHSCCKLEPWPATSARMLAKVAALMETESPTEAANIEAKAAELDARGKALPRQNSLDGGQRGHCRLLSRR